LKDRQKYEKLVRLRKLRVQIAINALSVQQRLVNEAKLQEMKAHGDLLELTAELNERDDDTRRGLVGNTISQAKLKRYRHNMLAIDQQLAEGAASYASASSHRDQMQADLAVRTADYAAQKKSLEQLESAFHDRIKAATLLQAELDDEDRDDFHSPNASASRAC
jgi:hypothetical protein